MHVVGNNIVFFRYVQSITLNRLYQVVMKKVSHVQKTVENKKPLEIFA